MKSKETEVAREIRVVRDRMARCVEQEGILGFYSSLEGRAAKLMAEHRSPQGMAKPLSLEARRAKRRALVDALAEPIPIREVRRLRQQLLLRKTRVGAKDGQEGVQLKSKDPTRRHGAQYVISPSNEDVLHDKPAKKNKA